MSADVQGYACEDCQFFFHGIPAITESGETLCEACFDDRQFILYGDDPEDDVTDDDWGTLPYDSLGD